MGMLESRNLVGKSMIMVTGEKLDVLGAFKNGQSGMIIVDMSRVHSHNSRPSKHRARLDVFGDRH